MAKKIYTQKDLVGIKSVTTTNRFDETFKVNIYETFYGSYKGKRQKLFKGMYYHKPFKGAKPNTMSVFDLPIKVVLKELNDSSNVSVKLNKAYAKIK